MSKYQSNMPNANYKQQKQTKVSATPGGATAATTAKDGTRVQFNNLVHQAPQGTVKGGKQHGRQASGANQGTTRAASSDQAVAMSALITQVPQGHTKPIVPAAGVVKAPTTAQNNSAASGPAASASEGLLPPQSPRSRGKKTLILDLDETLVHSSFRAPPEPCIVLPVEIDDKKFKVFVLVRPHAEAFLKEMQKYYEVVIYTASLSKYADPLMDILDKEKSVSARLFREHCTFYQGMYVKDMSEVGRDLRDVLIIDNSPTAYLFQPDNALPISSWYDDKNDRCLYDYIPFLKELSGVNDVRPVLKALNEVEASLRNADISDDGNGGGAIDNQHLVFLEHGIQACREQMSQVAKPAPMINVDNSQEDDDDVDDEQRSLHENFEDSPRQRGDGSTVNMMHKRSSQASLGISERSTPQVTVPDTETDCLLSSNWPLHLSSYNREKKLIRDVSTNSERFKNIQFGQQNQQHQAATSPFGAFLGSAYDINSPKASNWTSDKKSEFTFGKDKKPTAFNNFMSVQPQQSNNGPISPNELRYGMPGANNAAAHQTHRAGGHGTTQRHTNTPLTVQTSGGGFQRGRPNGQQSNQLQTSSSGSVDRSNKQAPRGSYRVGVMTSTNLASGTLRRNNLAASNNNMNFGAPANQGAYTPTQSHGQNARKMQFAQPSYNVSKTPNQTNSRMQAQHGLPQNGSSLQGMSEMVDNQHMLQDDGSQAAKSSINRTPSSTIAQPGRIMHMHPSQQSQSAMPHSGRMMSAQATSQFRTGSHEPDGRLPQDNGAGDWRRGQQVYQSYQGTVKQLAQTQTIHMKLSSDMMTGSPSHHPVSPVNLAQSRSLFGRNGALKSMRVDRTRHMQPNQQSAQLYPANQMQPPQLQSARYDQSPDLLTAGPHQSNMTQRSTPMGQTQFAQHFKSKQGGGNAGMAPQIGQYGHQQQLPQNLIAQENLRNLKQGLSTAKSQQQMRTRFAPKY